MSARIVNLEEDTPVGDRHRDEVLDIIAENMVKAVHTLKELVESTKVDDEHIPGIVKETDCWDIYNNEARKHDTALVKDWRESLNSLLLFASIFAAVLTAFIIESKRMLEPDQTEILVDLFSLYFSNIGNLSSTTLLRPKFEPKPKAVSINCLFFASLGASMIAGLASVVALQWVADYDAAITRGGSSPMDRAKRRQFRHAGVVRWKMGELIAALPLLLYSSVVLFWAGCMLWMYTINKTVAYVVFGSNAISLAFYTSTTLLATVDASAPFRTPLSWGIYWLFRRSLSIMARLVIYRPVNCTLQWSISFFQRIVSCIRPVDPVPPLSEIITRWIMPHTLPKAAFRKREDDAAESNPAFMQEALGWLSQQLLISTDARLRLVMFIDGMTNLPQDPSILSRFTDGPLLRILEHLSGYYMTKIIDLSLDEDEGEAVGVLLRYIQRPDVSSTLPPIEGYNLSAETKAYWFQDCFIPGAIPEPSVRNSGMTFLLARDVPAPSPGAKDDVKAAIMAIQWRNTHGIGWGLEIWMNIFSHIALYTPSFLESCLTSFGKMTMLPFFRPDGGGPLFSSIINQALNLKRSLTRGELQALAYAFEPCVTGEAHNSQKESDADSIIRRPLFYGLNLSKQSKECQELHHKLTILITRSAASFCEETLQRWARWIVTMTWIGRQKDESYWLELVNRFAREASTDVDSFLRNGEVPDLWNKVDMTWKKTPRGFKHSKEITHIANVTIWPFDNSSINDFSQCAFVDPSILTWLQDLFQNPTTCSGHTSGSQHILFHLHYGTLPESHAYVIKYRRCSLRLGHASWNGYSFYPILHMLSLCDDQNLSNLAFSKCLGFSINQECAESIWAMCKAVKKQPSSFLKLLIDIATLETQVTDVWPATMAIILKCVEPVIAMSVDADIFQFIQPLAHILRQLRTGMVKHARHNPEKRRQVAVEADRIITLLEATANGHPIFRP